MLGHELTLHETNGNGIVAICGCGWVGHVHVAESRLFFDGNVTLPLPDAALDKATAEHTRHCNEILAIVRRPGRWSHA